MVKVKTYMKAVCAGEVHYIDTLKRPGPLMTSWSGARETLKMARLANPT
jgi:hypothetical protein